MCVCLRGTKCHALRVHECVRASMFVDVCARACVLVSALISGVLSGKINAWFRVQGFGFKIWGLGKIVQTKETS